MMRFSYGNEKVWHHKIFVCKCVCVHGVSVCFSVLCVSEWVGCRPSMYEIAEPLTGGGRLVVHNPVRTQITLDYREGGGWKRH